MAGIEYVKVNHFTVQGQTNQSRRTQADFSTGGQQSRDAYVALQSPWIPECRDRISDATKNGQQRIKKNLKESKEVGIQRCCGESIASESFRPAGQIEKAWSRCSDNQPSYNPLGGCKANRIAQNKALYDIVRARWRSLGISESWKEPIWTIRVLHGVLGLEMDQAMEKSGSNDVITMYKHSDPNKVSSTATTRSGAPTIAVECLESSQQGSRGENEPTRCSRLGFQRRYQIPSRTRDETRIQIQVLSCMLWRLSVSPQGGGVDRRMKRKSWAA
ncbi:hypothetical protein B0H19DRAFT_1058703 [Mycena capillaripes]|nr:hypothetical protein B0H19DRAFT_1058703 [Mycena capillaripes]